MKGVWQIEYEIKHTNTLVWLTLKHCCISTVHVFYEIIDIVGIQLSNNAVRPVDVVKHSFLDHLVLQSIVIAN